jgi:hypothetical protein
MKKQHKKFSIQSIFYVVTASLLLLVGIAPALLGPQTALAGIVEPRQIQMSQSNAGQSSVTYTVKWTPTVTTSIGGVVVDFCSTSPIAGAICTAPTGFTTGGSSAATVEPSGSGLGTTGWSVWASSTASTLFLINSTPVTQSTTVADTFSITSVTNPTTVGTFYARILTFATEADAETYVSTTQTSSLTGLVDYGGDALSTTTEIQLQAIVQEALSFCIYQTSACLTTNSTSVNLGTPVNGVDIVEDSTVSTSTVSFEISTNAKNTVTVNLYGGTLTFGTYTIPAVGATAGPITAGTADFGLYLSALGAGMAAVSPYTTSSTTYALDTNTTSGTLSTYGESIAQMTGPQNSSVSTITYGVTASATTPSGIYTATHQLIATGSF